MKHLIDFENKHIKAALETVPPKFKIGDIVVSPFGRGVVTKVPQGYYRGTDGLGFDTYINKQYEVYFGMGDDKTNSRFFERVDESSFGNDEYFFSDAKRCIQRFFNE